MPLVWGQGPLTAANGFASQADVLIETRRAADLLGATPMDRPEDVETNPVTGIVYVVLTYNDKRKPDQVNALNPRGPNLHGHIVELIPPGGEGADRDHTATDYRWDIFLLAGDPSKPEDGARYHPQVSDNGWLSAPDNIAFDREGRIWIATDGLPRFGLADGAYVAETRGAAAGADPPLLPDADRRRTVRAGVQYRRHRLLRRGAAPRRQSRARPSTIPSTRWPDFQPGMPPRPSVQVIVKKGGGMIGS